VLCDQQSATRNTIHHKHHDTHTHTHTSAARAVTTIASHNVIHHDYIGLVFIVQSTPLSYLRVIIAYARHESGLASPRRRRSLYGARCTLLSSPSLFISFISRRVCEPLQVHRCAYRWQHAAAVGRRFGGCRPTTVPIHHSRPGMLLVYVSSTRSRLKILQLMSILVSSNAL